MTASTHFPTSILRDHLNALAGRRVFFGHKSVGANIVAGIEQLLAANPGARLRVVASDLAEALAEPGLVHCQVGTNCDPDSKIADFARLVRAGIGDRADAALFKFCFVDVVEGTDGQRLFGAYKAAMGELAAAYPRTTFAHATVPLQGRRRDWKGRVKRLLGRLKPFAPDNAARHRLNELLRREYGPRGVLFDLAAAESLGADGAPSAVATGAGAVPCLCPEYTRDGGHLNDRGARAVAERFVTFLASLPPVPRR
jgi:hypothetical protein